MEPPFHSHMKTASWRAVTRGDGKGDDVTDNVKQSVLFRLCFMAAIIRNRSKFEAKFRHGMYLKSWVGKEAREEPLFANPRNAASGTLKLQNSSIVASRKLDISITCSEREFTIRRTL